MRLKIDKISRKEINTTRGLSWKLSIFAGNQWYGAWAADWNAGWREGQTIDVELKTRQYQGKTYTDIKGPAQQGQTQQPAMVPDSHVLDEISRNLGQVMIEVLEIKKMMVALNELQGAPCDPPAANQSGPEEEVPPHTDEDMPF